MLASKAFELHKCFPTSFSSALASGGGVFNLFSCVLAGGGDGSLTPPTITFLVLVAVFGAAAGVAPLGGSFSFCFTVGGGVGLFPLTGLALTVGELTGGFSASGGGVLSFSVAASLVGELW